MKILVTGAAGFIGSYVVESLLKLNHTVIGIDNINNYYDTSLKEDRLKKIHSSWKNFKFYKIDLSDRSAVEGISRQFHFDFVVHLAAQAGVRYSIENPHAYIDSNIVSFLNILELCRQQNVDHLVYASSSSVYGMNQKIPFSIEDRVDNPISLYAATKKSNELMAHTYSHLYRIPTTGLRFFTVYGPWGRPDMAYFKFTKSIISGDEIDVFNGGDMRRDFTYIDDIVSGIINILNVVPNSECPYSIYNLGNNKPVNLMEMIGAIEENCGVKANICFKPMQPGDVLETFADIDATSQACGFSPSVNIHEGIREFVKWYRSYYMV